MPQSFKGSIPDKCKVRFRSVPSQTPEEFLGTSQRGWSDHKNQKKKRTIKEKKRKNLMMIEGNRTCFQFSKFFFFFSLQFPGPTPFF